MAGPGSNLPDKRYFRIGEVCKIAELKPHVLRYWETEFKQVRPQKNKANQRLYRKKDVETILIIKNLLHDQKYTIAGAKAMCMAVEALGRGRLAVKTMQEYHQGTNNLENTYLYFG